MREEVSALNDKPVTPNDYNEIGGLKSYMERRSKNRQKNFSTTGHPLIVKQPISGQVRTNA